MKTVKNIVLFFFLFSAAKNYAQLGFCSGSKGEPIFSENFGNGTNYGPALPSGVTNYPFTASAPNDGFYTLYYNTNLYSTWHYSLDHTPDATNGVNGKVLIVNANASTSGDFYKRIVTGLCINTTFEFSAWLMNIYNPASNYCGAGEIPINVRFEIWNDTETTLLSSGNTGNIIGTNTPIWQQFALVFTTTNQTSVVLKMKNNGLGGCGNDLAIDDISFAACGDLTTVTSQSVTGSNFTTCQNPVSIQLNATTSGSATYFYQWQSSIDTVNWFDIPGENTQTFTTPNLSSQIFYRTKIAQDLVNINNNFCSALSNVFSISFFNGPNAAISNGNVTICSNQTIPALTVSSTAGTSVNWYSAATGGTLLQSNSTTFTPTTSGTYYAEVYDIISNCKSATRTPVTLTIMTLPTASISTTATICSGNSATVAFSGTPNAIVTYTVDSGSNQTQTLNSSGQASVVLQNVTSTKVISLISVSSGTSSGCIQNLSQSITITITALPTASISATATICSGNSATLSFSGTPNAIVTYTVDSGSNQTQTLNSSGQASVVLPNVTSTKVISLISVSSGTSSGCLQNLSQSITISIIALPTASISATATICSENSATVAFSGTPNAIVTYTVDGGSNQTLTLNSSGQASVVLPNVTSTKVISLISVSSGTSSGCIQNLSQSIAISITAPPIASISATATICSGNSATIAFSGTPNAIVTYTVDSGSNQTQTLNSSGQASVVLPNVTSTKVISLISVSSGTSSGCIQNLSQSITISIIALPTASISATATICSGNSATIAFTGTPNAIVTYTVDSGLNQTQTLNSSGQASVVLPNVTSTKVISLISVSSGTSSGCIQNLSQSITINVIALPTATINANPTVICSNQNTTLTFTGTPNATVFYTTNSANPQPVLLDSSGNATVLIVALNTTTSYELTSVVLAANCSQLITDTVTVTVNQTPTASFTGNLQYCSGETTSIQLQSNIVGTTFSWTATQNNTTGATSGSGTQINQTIQTISDSNGSVIYLVTPEFNGCSGSPLTINVGITALPVPALQDGVICLFNSNPTSSQPFILNTALNSTGYSFQWFFEGNPIPNAFGNTYQANQVGQYGVIATNTTTGCVSTTVFATVSEIEKGESLVVQQSEAFSDSPTIIVTVIGGSGPFLYQIDDTNFQSSNTFYNIPAGTHTITVIDEVNCTYLTTTVTILDYPKFFTPNGDGFNDTWNIKGLNANPKIFIFDRYGKLIKQISTNGSGWDGTYNGHMMFSTDYWFTVTYMENGVEKIFKAHFTLKR